MIQDDTARGPTMPPNSPNSQSYQPFNRAKTLKHQKTLEMSEIKSFRSSSRILLEEDDDMLGTKTPPLEDEEESTIHNE